MELWESMMTMMMIMMMTAVRRRTLDVVLWWRVLDFSSPFVLEGSVQCAGEISSLWGVSPAAPDIGKDLRAVAMAMEPSVAPLAPILDLNLNLA